VARWQLAWKRAIFATTELLARHPELGIKTDYAANVRRWPMTQYDYAIFYRVGKEDLDILRVLDGKLVQDLHGLPRSKTKRGQGKGEQS
jgi:plasmid stabilization system protein ParE